MNTPYTGPAKRSDDSPEHYLLFVNSRLQNWINETKKGQAPLYGFQKRWKLAQTPIELKTPMTLDPLDPGNPTLYWRYRVSLQEWEIAKLERQSPFVSSAQYWEARNNINQSILKLLNTPDQFQKVTSVHPKTDAPLASNNNEEANKAYMHENQSRGAKRRQSVHDDVAPCSTPVKRRRTTIRDCTSHCDRRTTVHRAALYNQEQDYDKTAKRRTTRNKNQHEKACRRMKDFKATTKCSSRLAEPSRLRADSSRGSEQKTAESYNCGGHSLRVRVAQLR